MHRRSVLKLAAGTALLGAGAHLGLAAPALATGQAPGYFRFALGDFMITVVSDGHLETPASLLGAGQDPQVVAEFLRSRALDPVTNYAHTNLTLIDTGERKILVDVGSGDRFQPTAGRLLDNLDAAGIAPEEVDTLVITHAHPDHVWGMMDDFDDLMRLPDAQPVIGATEFDWWMQDGRVDSVPEAMQPFVVGARNALSPVAERIRRVNDGDEVAPGVSVMATPGHTPGHLSVVARSGDQALLVTGDAINHPYVSFEHPDWHFGFDMDRKAAAETRRLLLTRAAADEMTVVGYHLPFPGVGRVARRGDRFSFLPAVWRWDP